MNAQRPAGAPDPDVEPVPVAGCEVCDIVNSRREMARAAGRTDTVHSCNDELRNHPHWKVIAR